jgi:hypothetical protein
LIQSTAEEVILGLNPDHLLGFCDFRVERVHLIPGRKLIVRAADEILRDDAGCEGLDIAAAGGKAEQNKA